MIDFDFDKDYVLEDDCVLLRPLTIEDSINLLYFSQNEPDIWKYSLQSAAGVENLQQYISIAMKGRESKTEYPFIVFDKRTQQYAGSTRFYDILPTFQTMQLGYTWYGESFQGTGLNRHCKFLLFSFAFEKVGLERLELRADNDNARSIAAMKSIGCKVDGILRANMPRPKSLPGRRDSIVLSVLKEEWFNEVKPLLLSKLNAVTSTKGEVSGE
jgi:RimJ/RimL family protein N-acetyltransferase